MVSQMGISNITCYVHNLKTRRDAKTLVTDLDSAPQNYYKIIFNLSATKILLYTIMKLKTFCAKTLEESVYFRKNMCWLNTPSLWITFLGVVGIILVYNLIVVILITKKALLKKEQVSKLIFNNLFPYSCFFVVSR